MNYTICSLLHEYINCYINFSTKKIRPGSLPGSLPLDPPQEKFSRFALAIGPSAPNRSTIHNKKTPPFKKNWLQACKLASFELEDGNY